MKHIYIIPILISCFVLIFGADISWGEDLSSEIDDMLRKLGENVAGFQNLKTDFVQEKDLAIFNNKITMKGRIYLQKKPNKIAWHVDEPVRYSVLITDTSIRQWDEDTNRVQEIALSGNPVFQNILGQLTVWFSGDYISLLRDYDARIIQRSPLVFGFIPKSDNIAGKVIRSITIEVREDVKYLKQIRILEVGGDSTTIMFKGTVFDAPSESLDFEVKKRVR